MEIDYFLTILNAPGYKLASYFLKKRLYL